MQSNAQNECKGSDEQTIDNTINDTTGNTTSDDTQRVMSKNQMKKLLRHKKWLETRPERRRQEKERKKLKAKKLREEGIEMKSRSALRKQWIPMSESKCKVSVLFEIMLLASNGSSSDWSDIFKKVIPIRKMKQ
ncbi:unnamed protein product [Oppiella nova]|uniref:Uncharacterized protein n=1 Tax=Oppiella nova TaxID=334625 RepID=A0A7R9LCP0_9ACAR|nr:unnamed protein product [Oppiella nova]CAG2161456.1 unnamed protein product [Oppiella nova]